MWRSLCPALLQLCTDIVDRRSGQKTHEYRISVRMKDGRLNSRDHRPGKSLTQDLSHLLEHSLLCSFRCLRLRQDVEGKLSGENLVGDVLKIQQVDSLLLQLV